MTNLIVSKGYILKAENSFIKRITISLSSDDIQGINVFNHKHVNSNGSFAPYISASGVANTITITGSTWSDINNLKNLIVAEFTEKFNAFKNSQDFENIPTQEIIPF